MIFFLIFFTLITPKNIVIEEVTKDGIYLNIGKLDGVEEFDELHAKSHKLKIIKLTDSHSIACLLDKDSGCDYNISKMLNVKKLKFTLKKKNVGIGGIPTQNDDKDDEEKFVRHDTKAFKERTQEELEFFQNSNKVFDLIIFNDNLNKRDLKYKIYGGLNLYNIVGIKLLESDFNYFNNILQGDLAYEDDFQEFNFIFDTNVFLQKQFNDFSASIYKLSYAIKYNKFTFKVGRDNLNDLNDFYLTDGLFINYENKNLKFGLITAFGIDYYDDMLTDFNHIYIGGFGKFKLNFNEAVKYNFLLGVVPEIFNNALGVLPVYVNNTFEYKDKLDFNYMFKMSYSQLETEKILYFNHYATLDLNLIKKLNIRLGFDSREYLDLINYSYYESVLEKIDSDKSKNAHANISYKFDKDLLSFSYKRRFNLGGANEFTLRYLMYYFTPLDYSFRITSLLMEDVDLYIANTNVNYSFSDDFRVSGNLFVMIEDPKILNELGFGITPEISVYKKFFSYFYLKGSVEFELRAKRVRGVLKIGYIFNNRIW